jgi:hypothetical protein
MGRTRSEDALSETESLVAGLVELDAESDNYRRAMAYYTGDVDEKFASSHVQRETGGSAGWYQINAARCPVDAVTDRLGIDAVTALHPDGSPFPEANIALQRQVWELNGLDRQIPRLIRDTGIYGDGHLFIWPNPEGSRKPVTVAYNSPLGTRVIYDPEDDSTPLHAVKRWDGPGCSDNANFITDTEVIRYIRDPAGKWTDPEAWTEVARTEHDLGRNPVEHFATWMPYGRPEHKDAYGSQNAITKIAPTMVDSAEANGYPSRYTITDPDASVRGDRSDGLDFPDSDPQDMTTGTKPSKLRVGPGEIAELQGVTSAGQWSAASSDTFINAGNWFMRAMAQTTTTPLHMMDPSGSVPTGESRRIADAPLEVKVKLRRSVYGSGLESSLGAALRALGYDAIVRVKWAPSPVADDTITWQVASAKMTAGVPPEVALTETGLYDPDVVHQWFNGNPEEMGLARRVTILSDLAAAVAQLSAGVAGGILDQDQARLVVAQTVNELVPTVTPDVQA